MTKGHLKKVMICRLYPVLLTGLEQPVDLPILGRKLMKVIPRIQGYLSNLSNFLVSDLQSGTLQL